MGGNKRTGESGQVLVLGALGLLVVALMVFITLNLGQAVYEKIRIQQLADTAAFSLAVQQARAFNFFAYTNRANISTLAAASSVHAYGSLYSSVPGLYGSTQKTYFFLAGIEGAACLSCIFVPSMCQHCAHAFQHVRSALKAGNRSTILQLALSLVDIPFKDTINALDEHMTLIARSQAEVRLRLVGQIYSDTIAKELKNRFAPQATVNPLGVIGLNLTEYLDVFQKDQEIIRYVATEIANGSRWSTLESNQDFVSNRSLADMARMVNPLILIDLLDKVGKASKGHTIPIKGDGQARVIREPAKPIDRIRGNAPGPLGDTVASYDQPSVMTTAIELCALSAASIPFSTPAWIASGPETGAHRVGMWPCIRWGTHLFKSLSQTIDPGSIPGAKKIPGVDSIPPPVLGPFTELVSQPDATKDYGQPAVYSFVTQDLRLQEGGSRGPWEITRSGSVSVTLGKTGRHQVDLAMDPAKFGYGVAIGKALVYYHVPLKGEGWREPPSFFNPYWKAKLQPFRDSNEVQKVLTAGGIPTYYRSALLAGSPLP